MCTSSVWMSEGLEWNVAPGKRAVVDVFESHAYTYLHIQIHVVHTCI